MIDGILTQASSIALILRVLSCVILLVFCIPLMLKEARVKNGLRALRIQLFSLGLILFLTNAVSIWLLYTLDGNIANPIRAALQIFNGASFFILAIISFAIYHGQYSEENKKLHAKKK